MTCCPYETINTTGGVKASGTATVDIVGDLYDGFHAVYPLDEYGEGVENEYQDRTSHALHGSGGAADSDLEYVPVQDQGVFCNFSQHSDGRQYITLPEDELSESTDFTISMWVKIESFYSQRTWYSRGHETEVDKWTLRFGHNFLNKLSAAVQVNDADGFSAVVEVEGITTLSKDTWYHVALVVEPSVSIRVHLNGVLDGTTELTQSQTVLNSNNGFILRWNDASVPKGNVQELRIIPEIRSSAYILAERNNFCSSFYSVGEETEELIEL